MGLWKYVSRIRSAINNITRNVGKFLERAAFVAVLATGVGAIQYIRGKWPFTEIEEREYHMTQWFNEVRGPALGPGPGTRWLVRPFIRKVKINGEIAAVSAETLEQDCGRFKFRSKDGLEGMIRAQYLYRIEDEECARKFFWDYGADTGRIDVIVKGALVSKIGNVRGEDIASGFYVDDEGELKDYLEEAEVEANRRMRIEEVGVTVTNFAISEPDFNPASEKILQQVVSAEKERQATLIQADATAKSAATYLAAARMYAVEGSDKKPGDIALYLANLDNNQEIAAKEGRIIKYTAEGLQYQVPSPVFGFPRPTI